MRIATVVASVLAFGSVAHAIAAVQVVVFIDGITEKSAKLTKVAEQISIINALTFVPVRPPPPTRRRAAD